MLDDLDKKEAIELLSDDYIPKILAHTHLKPKSAKEIAAKNDIPIAVCYRRIKKLVDLGLLSKEERPLTQEGKRVWLYKSNLESAKIFYEDGVLMAEFEMKSGVTETFGKEQLITVEH